MDAADAREEACEAGLFVVVFDYKAVLIVKHIFPFLNHMDNDKRYAMKRIFNYSAHKFIRTRYDINVLQLRSTKCSNSLH